MIVVGCWLLAVLLDVCYCQLASHEILLYVAQYTSLGELWRHVGRSMQCDFVSSSSFDFFLHLFASIFQAVDDKAFIFWN